MRPPSPRADSLQDARLGLEALQQEDGHWVFELEAGRIKIWRDYFDMATYQRGLA